MGKTATFYTEEQKNILKSLSQSRQAKRNYISEATGALILDALGEQQNALQNIEEILQRIEKIILLESQNQ